MLFSRERKFKRRKKIIVIGNKSFHSSSDKLSTAKDFEEVLDSEFTSEDLLNPMQFPEEFYDFDQKILNKNHGSNSPLDL